MPEPAGPADAVGGLSGVRVVVVGPEPPPAGGMAVQTRALIDGLRRSGARPVVVVTNAAYRPAWVERLRGVRALARLLPYIAKLWGACGRADIVHIMANSGWSWFLFAVPALLIGAVRRVPRVVNYHGGQAGAFLARAGALARPTLKLADAVVVPSGFLRDTFGAHGVDSRTIPIVIDLERFRYEPPVAARPEAPTVLVARNLEAVYGVDTALGVFARLRERIPGACLVVTGSGPERAALEKRAEALGVGAAVTFTGQIDADGMAARYAEADLLLNTSRADNMPNTLLEGMASGVPVVSTAAGGIPYIVDDGRTGLLAPVDDVPALAEACLRVLDSPERARALAEAAVGDVRAYQWSAVGGRWADVYRRLIGKEPS